MSIARLKEIKQDIKYNSPVAFLPTGIDVKILIDAIEESVPNEILDPIKQSKGYNSTIGMTLSGIDVKRIVDAIPCPSDNLKIIKNQLRYNKRHEYILTGKHIKILVENVEDTSCLVPPVVENSIYSFTFGSFTVGDIATDGGSNFVASAAGQVQSFLMSQGYELAGEIFYDPAYGQSGTVVGWIECPTGEQPTDWTWDPDSSGIVPITWIEVHNPVEYKCYRFDIDTLGTPLSDFYANPLSTELADTHAVDMPTTVFDDVNYESTLQYFANLALGVGTTVSIVYDADPAIATIYISNTPIVLTTLTLNQISVPGTLTFNAVEVSC